MAITLSDDDEMDVAIISDEDQHEVSCDIQSTITCDSDDSVYIQSNNNCSRRNSGDNDKTDVIIINDVTVKDKNYDYDEIYKENKLFAEFIEKCLELQNCDGMLRVIDKTLLPLFKNADKTYKQSSSFEKTLNEAIMNLETNPKFKFTHIKKVCESLKCLNSINRVQIVTLATNLKENRRRNNKRKLKTKSKRVNKKRGIVDVIDLDAIEVKTVPVINLDESENDTIVLDERQENDETETIAQEKSPDLVAEKLFLVPKRTEIPVQPNEEPLVDMKKIEQIEKEIAECKERIEKLDEEEVDGDTQNSPYILSEKLKEKVVHLYKMLCELTGSEAIKRHRIRLRVLDGLPPGPVSKLEKFLNDKIGPNGEPPFPDFLDVVKCVVAANEDDHLGWNEKQIINEANALFVQCGQALQKRRQKREWRYLIGRLNMKQCDGDPADDDPELEAKLQENRKIAINKEHDVFERYTRLQYLPTSKNALNSGQNLVSLVREDSEKSIVLDLDDENKHISDHNYNKMNDNSCNEDQITSDDNEDNVQKIKGNDYEEQVACDNNEDDAQNNKENNCEKQFVYDNNEDDAQSNKENNCEKQVVCDNNEDDAQNNKAKRTKMCDNGENDAQSNKENDCEELPIKKEKDADYDISEQLAELGDDFMSSVIEIEDPFLIIEISDSDNESESESNSGPSSL